KKRVMARDNLSEEMVEAKIASQMSDKKKALLASEIIDNSGTMEETYANVDRLLEKYL
ncbi:MAG: dephospho-CoA kinase, partial [Firmicutes bacterium]|nr:dephospho-CoA kinase [Bacillota bacterium]